MASSKRIQNIIAQMERVGADTLLAVAPENVHYLSGFYTVARSVWQIGQTACLLKSDGTLTLFLPSPWDEEYEAPSFCRIVGYNNGVDGLADVLFPHLSPAYFCDAEWIRYPFMTALRACGAAAPKDGSIVFNRCRMIKDEDEIAALYRAVSIIDSGLEVSSSAIVPGAKEKDIQALINSSMIKLGSEGNGFTTKVITGTNGSQPHHVPGDTLVESGSSTIVDLSAIVEGYESDSARTFITKGASMELTRIHAEITDILEDLPRILQPGLALSELNRILRERLSNISPLAMQAGTIGHGVGLWAHEYPDIRADSSEVLQQNMVLAIEPALYLKGSYGVRIENMFLISSCGATAMNSFPLNRYDD